jgi:fructose-1,6-bisphosphatase/inositol monophosphatase family enzyme
MMVHVDATDALELLDETSAAIASRLDGLGDWGPAGTKPGQYRSDLAADAAALAVLEPAGVAVLSEESGSHWVDRAVTVVVDPLDGSTNASRGVPWFATSLCAVDGDGPLAALVVDLASGTRFAATRGGGATRDGRAIAVSGAARLGSSLVALSGLPPGHLGWKQFRAFGAAALDLCAVASGVVDAYIDCSPNAHGSWDYLGGLLICLEAGGAVADAEGRDLVSLEHSDRRTPLAAATPALLDEVVAARRSFG